MLRNKIRALFFAKNVEKSKVEHVILFQTRLSMENLERARSRNCAVPFSEIYIAYYVIREYSFDKSYNFR